MGTNLTVLLKIPLSKCSIVNEIFKIGSSFNILFNPQSNLVFTQSWCEVQWEKIDTLFISVQEFDQVGVLSFLWTCTYVGIYIFLLGGCYKIGITYYSYVQFKWWSKWNYNRHINQTETVKKNGIIERVFF